MDIRRLHVENFKNYKDFKIEFRPGINLLVGTNGSGKTSLLEAINVAMGGFFASRAPKYQRYIHFDEIRLTDGIREPYAMVSASSETIRCVWSRRKNSDGKNDSSSLSGIKEVGHDIYTAFENPNDRTIAPLLAYYSTQRLFRDAKQSKEQNYDAANGRRNGYLQCLEENAIKEVLKVWLGNAVTRRATLKIKEIDRQDLVLENVEAAIRRTLLHFFDLNEDFPLKIYQDPDYGNELFLQFGAEQNLPLSYYSDGVRNLLYLVIDLIWRASQLNPWLSLNELSQTVPGIVTIDEIDLHLHPRWQAKATDLLQLLLPKVQFFITTHSPTVVTNLKEGTLYIITRGEVYQYQSKYFGKEINSVLREVLKAPDRPAYIQDKIDTLLGKISDNGSEVEAEIMLNDLVSIIGQDDRELQTAASLLEWNKYKLAN